MIFPTYLVDDVRVIDIVGRFTLNGGAMKFSYFMSQLAMQRNPDKVVFNLRQAEDIDTTGIRVFKEAIEEIRDRGGRVMLSGITEKVQRIFDVTAFNGPFEIHDTIAHAIAALA